MKHEGSWRQALPPDAPEREFLLVAEADRPPAAAVDRGWTAFCAAAGIASVATVAAPGVAATAAPTAGAAAGKAAATATVATVSKATLGIVGTSAAAKAVVVGFVVGMGALGTNYAIRQVRNNAWTPSAAAPAASSAQRAARTGIARQSGQAASSAAASSLPNQEVAAEILPQPGRETAPERAATSGGVSRRDARSPGSTVTLDRGNDVRDDNDSLAAQAEQLAQLKRLLDSGSTHEAAAQLQTLAARGELSALAEDRDALLIQALVKTGHSVEATALAEQFFKRYPTSPHRQRLRQLLGSD